MTTEFDRQLYGFRFAETQHGDTLQRIASRELGDAGRWVEIVELNKLLPPFITDDASQASSTVLLTGRQIKLPAPVATVTTTIDPDAVFEVDVQLARGGEMVTDGIDFVLVSGRANLRQALKNRIETDLKELMFHPSYGCDVRRIVGKVNGPTAGLLGARAVKFAALQETRISRVNSATATIGGDVLSVAAEVEVVAGRPVQVAATP